MFIGAVIISALWLVFTGLSIGFAIATTFASISYSIAALCKVALKKLEQRVDQHEQQLESAKRYKDKLYEKLNSF